MVRGSEKRELIYREIRAHALKSELKESMSWLRGSPLRQSFKRGRATLDSSTIDCDPKACFDSFRKHWQQAYDVMQKVRKLIKILL